jgi:hypothetical protein
MKQKIILSFLLLLSILFSSCIPEDIIVGSSSQIYECVSRQLIESCPEGLSPTLKSCYYMDGDTKRSFVCKEGWILYEEEPVTPPPPPQDNDKKPYKSGSYHCYPSFGCCREHGLLSNDCVPMGEVI